MAPGWTRSESPFHQGELDIQARLGAEQRINQQGRRMIREYLTEPHRQFFAQLAYIIVGTVDASGFPWASILTGSPGFLSTPDEQTLRVMAQPLAGDPLISILSANINVGLLGIELHSRRRVRVNGEVNVIYPNGFKVRVGQSFGNCPQYIQSRLFEPMERNSVEPRLVHEITTLSAPEKAIITAADTFFITTAYQDRSAGAASGVDASHRGGKPGFVRVEGDRTLTIPDFSGNYHFNTLGNIVLNPQAGLLFIDFDKGDLLLLTGKAEIIWEGAEVEAYAGAERLLRFQLTRGCRAEHSLPQGWSAPEFSPFLKQTGPW